jgi:hypothetical protein
MDLRCVLQRGGAEAAACVCAINEQMSTAMMMVVVLVLVEAGEKGYEVHNLWI